MCADEICQVFHAMGFSGGPEEIRAKMRAEKDRLLRDPAYFREWMDFLWDCESLDSRPHYLRHVCREDDVGCEMAAGWYVEVD